MSSTIITRFRYTSGTVARQLDVSVPRVHQLEAAGVLRAVRTPTGVRLFDPEQVEAVRLEREQRRQARGR